MATETTSGAGGTVEERKPAPATAAGGRGARGSGRGPGSRVTNYYREVFAELRKVIYPSRNELVTYVAVVLIFVTVMVALVAGLDYLATKAVLALFG